ncbi:Butyrophilin subfamily 2 member A1 [Collichthys lucidus]|uniref:Butyrophilin subfamily 2 member A1 n=1 Tax=Collichthys lucidus TaxID=240159 RepID=A0A4U5VWT5_COLLU|nr:Butyrophilin subfamily 2 member A1 [Collichthys lucidus]
MDFTLRTYFFYVNFTCGFPALSYSFASIDEEAGNNDKRISRTENFSFDEEAGNKDKTDVIEQQWGALYDAQNELFDADLSVNIDRTTSGVVLECESKGWHPEPEVFWLDGDGNFLSAGPTDTVQGADDLYTVSSRVTVEKRHSNNFTCKVQQKNINQTRETNIHISDKEENSNSKSTKTESGEMEQLMTDETVQKEVFNKGKGQKEKKHSEIHKSKVLDRQSSQKVSHTTMTGPVSATGESKVFDGQKSQKVSHTTMTGPVSATGDIIVDKVDPEGKHGHLRNMSKKPEIHKFKVFDRQNSQKVSHTTITGPVSATGESKVFDSQNSQKVSPTTMTGPVSATGDIIVDKVDPEGKYVRLKNISTKFHSMKDWELHIQINNRKPIMHTFNSQFGLRRGNTVTIWSKKSGVTESHTDVVTLKSWGIGERLLVTLYRDTGESVISEARNLVNCGTSLASQDSDTGHINVDDVDPEGKYVRLKNMSYKKQQMKDWELHIQVDNRKPIIISTFDCRVHLNPEQTVTIWAKNFAFIRAPGDLLSSNSWDTGKQLLVTLYSDTGESSRMLFHTNRKLIILYLLLTQCCRGESQLINSPQTIIATLGHDIILPCHLVPGEDASDLTLEWTRPDLNPRFVHVYRFGEELVDITHKLFKKRTSLFTNELKLGNISLKLSKVKIHDEGTFRCFIPEKQKQSFVQLVVGSDAVTSPIITLAGIDKATNGVNLQCNSEGWYPEPVVFWLDGKGNVLSAGPTETVRGPDDLYAVSSRVTVEKRHSNSFTCRVQQKIMNQTREAHIHVSDKEENSNSKSTKTEGGENEQLMTDETVQKEVFNKGKGQKEKKHSEIHKSKVLDRQSSQKVSHTTMTGPVSATGESKVFDGQKSQKVSHTTMTGPVSATGDIIVDKVDPEGKHGHLRNVSKKPEIHKSKVFDRQSSQKVSHTTITGPVSATGESKVFDSQSSQKVSPTTMTGPVSATGESKVFDSQSSQKVSPTTMTGPVSATGDIIVDKVDPEGKYVRLKNISTKYHSMKDWELHIQINNRKPIMHIFNSKFGLRRGNTVTIWSRKSGVTESHTDVVTLKSWGIVEQLLVTLYRDTGESVISEAQNLVSCGTSLASQDSVTGHIIVDDVDPEGKYVRLKNISDKEQQMKDWELHTQVDNRKPIIISTFDCVHLNPGQTVTIWAKNFAFMRAPGDLPSLESWDTGKQLLVTLYSDTGETKRRNKVETENQEKKNDSKSNKTDNQFVTEEESERENLMSNEAVQMEDLNKVKEKNKKKHPATCKVFDLQNAQQVTQAQGNTNSDSATGHIVVGKVDPKGKYVELRNMSHEDQQIQGWELHVRVNNKKPIAQTFPYFVFQKDGGTTKIIMLDNFLTDQLEWKRKFCKNGDRLLIDLYSDTGEKKQMMKDWELYIQVDNRKPIVIYTFDSSFKLNPGQTVTVYSKESGFTPNPPTNPVSSESWSSGDQLLVTLYSDTGEV